MQNAVSGRSEGKLFPRTINQSSHPTQNNLQNAEQAVIRLRIPHPPPLKNALSLHTSLSKSSQERPHSPFFYSKSPWSSRPCATLALRPAALLAAGFAALHHVAPIHLLGVLYLLKDTVEVRLGYAEETVDEVHLQGGTTRATVAASPCTRRSA